MRRTPTSILKSIRYKFLEAFFKIEYHLLKLFGINEKVFKLKRGKMLLPLSPTPTGNSRRRQVKELYTDEVLQDILKPGMTVLECGASLGYFTVFISKLLGEQGRCFSFEFMPDYIHYFSKSLELNDIKNVEHIPQAVGLKDSKPLEIDESDSTSYRAISSLWNFEPKKYRSSESEKTGNTKKVDVIALSNFVQDRKLKPDFLFLDIEGCENLVFEDILENLNDDELPNVYFESHQQIYGDDVLGQIFSKFEKRNFSKKMVTKNHFLMVPPRFQNLQKSI